MAVLFVPPHVEETPPPQMCEYQVKVDVGVYRCYTAKEYAVYTSNKTRGDVDSVFPAIVLIIFITFFMLGFILTNIKRKK